ncbi:MAG: hypothetical protein JG766_19 [Desulfacinum sp.]|jgi:hypothetical protein|nr:hypothetical protein [Desulfacinum sp.]
MKAPGPRLVEILSSKAQTPEKLRQGLFSFLVRLNPPTRVSLEEDGNANEDG